MNEVSPDYDNLKTSVFHRLLQRAFPEWFLYFYFSLFNEFYTAQTNAQFALQQGYGPTFKLDRLHFDSVKSTLVYPASDPVKPPKPLFLNKYDDIRWVLSTGANQIIHPAFADSENLPKEVQGALALIQSENKSESVKSLENVALIKAYFTMRTRAILEREAIKMSSDTDQTIYQVDVTRE